MRNAGYTLLVTGVILSLTNNYNFATVFYIAASCCFLTKILDKGR